MMRLTKVLSKFNKFYIRDELHGFSDSSQNAYGACTYLRTIDNNGQVHCNLLCAKNKVAPLKTITIPRLELSAAVLLPQLLNKVKNNLNITINDSYYWTDSTIVFCWIKMQTNSLKTFVAHRVATIQNLTSSDNWRYINSTENPADILSRGTNPQKLQNNNLWWFGPQFLSQNNLDLSSSIKQPYQCPAEIPEVKTTCANNAVAIPKFHFISLYKNSSFKKCLRITVSEIRNAHTVVIKLTQSESFAADIRKLKKHGELPKGSKLIKLNPYLDQDGLLRVGGRLKFAKMNEDQKHQLILPKSHQSRARILGKMDYFYFLRHMYETCL
jgi:hypothetical protein